MDKNKNNPPAFPLAYEFEDTDYFANEGMTLRDYFAAKAMQAIVSKNEVVNSAQVGYDAYDIADEMLKVRE